MKAATGRREADAKVFEALVRMELIDVDIYSAVRTPHVPNNEHPSAASQHSNVVGWVRVTMSPLPLLAKRQRSDGIHVMIAGVSLMTSLGIGLYLAMGLTRPLANTITALSSINRARKFMFLVNLQLNKVCLVATPVVNKV